MSDMDDINGRPASEAPSSSSSDFYNTDPKDSHCTLPASAAHSKMVSSLPITVSHIQHDVSDDDSDSEMDMSPASSRAASPEPPPQRAQHATDAGTKRKLSDSAHVPNGSAQATDEVRKRPRLSASPAQEPIGSPGPAGLPVEIWQQVFLYLPPAVLCRCLRVCQDFNAYLTSTKAAPAAKKGQTKVRTLDSEAIWTQARKTYFPSLPRPLLRCTELEMLQLIGGQTCQFCTRAPMPSPANTPFNCGPGPDGLRVIWPFGIRACGRCIENNTLKDVQILVSNASSLRFGLAHAFLTPDLHFVPEIQRQMPGGIPAHLRVTKVYYTRDIEDITEELDNAKSFGEGAADEWRKGLHTKGKERMADAARWEKWEGQMRLGSDLSQVLREYDTSSFPRHLDALQGRSAMTNGAQQPVVVSNGADLLPQAGQQLYQSGYGTPLQLPTLQFLQAHRPVRNPYEVEEARQARKVEIERRCMELEPPIEPSVLQHMESFQAAMQITMPMTDSAWDMLQPRILAQREAAELTEHQRAEQLAALQAAIPSSGHDESFIKPAKDVYDKEYEHAQEPLRKKLGEYAESFIQGHWNGAKNLDKDNCPLFAVQTMFHVRQRYFEEKEAGNPPSPEPHHRKLGSKQGSPPPEPFLSLDNMKWVFDNKIRPHTDNHRRELFICSGCAAFMDERKPKWFAFEGLIQHYGAKHTTAFSKGNIVVHWQTAAWPDDPPFLSNPLSCIKFDRKTSEHRVGHGRPRNTPQAFQHEGPFAPPAASIMLSESPYFASNVQQSPQMAHAYYGPAPQYPPTYGYGQGSPPVAAYGYPYPPPAVPAEPAIDMSEHAKINKLSTDARAVWDELEGVKDILECIRIKTVFYHVVDRFNEHFHKKPSLDLVTDALATNMLLRPVKNAHGLACKTCVAAQPDGSAEQPSYYARIQNVKLYNVSSLISHFKIVHRTQENWGSLDWTKDMIELPELQLVTDLMRMPGMDDDKLVLIAAAFPEAFPTPLPTIGVVQEPPPDLGPDSGLASRLLNRFNKKPKQQSRKKGGHANGTNTPGRETSQEPLPEPKEDEYDPRRPMFLQTESQAPDPARFDTDIARKACASTTSPLSAGMLNLAPETLAALNNLTALTQQPQQSQDDRMERSPSVGAPEPQKPTHGAASGQAPDIAAILASLTGQAQPSTTSTPPASNRSGSAAPRHAHTDSYAQTLEVSPRPHQGDRLPSPRYGAQSAYRASAEPPRFDGADQSASRALNVRHYEYNRAYAEPSYASPAPPPPRSPPRYRYVYDDGSQAYAPPPQQVHHAYREREPPPPVQYIQLPPEQQRGYHQYDRERTIPVASHAARPVYVDELGRPIQIIPVETHPAPAPPPVTTHYAPYPFDQLPSPQQYYTRQLTEPVPTTYAPLHQIQPHSVPAPGYVATAPIPQDFGERRPVYAHGHYDAQGRLIYDDGGARASAPRG